MFDRIKDVGFFCLSDKDALYFDPLDFSLHKASWVTAKSHFFCDFDINLYLVKDYVSLVRANPDLIDLYYYLSFTHVQGEIVISGIDCPLEKKNILDINDNVQEVIVELDFLSEVEEEKIVEISIATDISSQIFKFKGFREKLSVKFSDICSKAKRLYELSVKTSRGKRSGFYSYSYMLYDQKRISDFRFFRMHRSLKRKKWVGNLFWPKRYVSLDCEWARGKNGNVLGSVAVVDENNVLLSTYVKPLEEVLDYNTCISGLSLENMASGQDYKIVRSKVLDLIRGKVLVGYDLRADFMVLDIQHDHVVDFYDYGFPKLSYMFLFLFERVIQEKEHNSLEDAQSVMNIFLYFREYFSMDNVFLERSKLREYDILRYLFSRRTRPRMRFERTECCDHLQGPCYKFYSVYPLMLDSIYRCSEDFESKYSLLASVYAEIISLYYMDNNGVKRYDKERVDLISQFYMSFLLLDDNVPIKLPFRNMNQRLDIKEFDGGSYELHLLLNSLT